MIQMRLVILTLFIGMTVLQINFAQSEIEAAPSTTYTVIATARVVEKGVELRWYPGSAGVWRLASREGYLLERMEISEAGERRGWVALGGGLIKPYSEDDWRNRTDLNNDYVKAAYRAISEPTEAPARNADFQSWKTFNDQENGLFLFFTLATNLHADAAFGAGLRYLDNDIEPGKGYIYRVSVPAWKGEVDQDYSLVLVEDTKATYLPPTVTGVRAEEMEGVVRIFWPTDPNEVLFPTFHVEKSKDGLTWNRLNQLPIYFASEDNEEMFYTDSVENYQSHYYRVVGITPFADQGIPSEPLEAMGRDRTPPIGATSIKAEGDSKSVLVTWDLPAQSPDMTGFIIGRSGESSSQFNIITPDPLPVTARQFKDLNPSIKEPFYIVYAIDEAGNRGPTFAALANLSDNEPPAQPVGLTGSCDTAGIVVLNWHPNTEEDLAGYHVHVANHRDDVYRPLTGRPVNLTEWLDTVDMTALNRPMYYKITAVDFHNNPSAYSEILEVLRPDIIPPAAPVITEYSVEDEAVQLNWHFSPSQDVVAHELTRIESGKEDSKQVIWRTDSRDTRSYRDEEVTAGKSYTYALIARDAAGWQTESDPLEISVYDRGIRPGITNLEAQIDESGGSILLTWQYDGPDTDHRYVIYRRLEGGQPLSYRSLSSQNRRFQDPYSAEKPYQYAVKIIFPSGAESPLSTWVPN